MKETRVSIENREARVEGRKQEFRGTRQRKKRQRGRKDVESLPKQAAAHPEHGDNDLAKDQTGHGGLENQPTFSPWLELLPSSAYCSNHQLVHDEIIAYTNYLQPTPQEMKARDATFQAIRRIIQRRLSNAEVDLYGSAATGLSLPNGDLDIIVSLPASINVKKTLYLLARVLNSSGITLHVDVIPWARVPILTFETDARYGSFSVDIGINNIDGLRSRDFVIDHLAKMPALRPLFLVAKGFLLRRHLNCSSRASLGSYALICMCISFLQLNPGGQPQDYLDNPYENCSLGFILTDFMHWYGIKFPYSTSFISIADGNLLPKDSVNWLSRDVPNRISIQNPIHLDSEVAKAVGKVQMQSIIHEFREAYAYLLQTAAASRDILGPLVSMTQTIIERRATIQKFVDSRDVERLDGVMPIPVRRTWGSGSNPHKFR